VTLPRVHLFELNDDPRVPRALRDTVIETLSRTLAWGGILRGLVEPFARFLDATGATEVLDLCSGAGGPAVILAEELSRAGRSPPRFVLTDFQPQLGTWERIRRAHAGTIDYVAYPVDATRIPESLGGTVRPRVIVNALHHFRPELARSVLCGAAQGAPGVFVAEGFVRNPLRFAPYVLAGIPALFANPVLSPQDHLQKAVVTYLMPVSLAACAWDGVVSTLRVYTEAELRAMVAPLGPSFAWEYGTYRFAPFGRGSYFFGLRR
jgi:hypothetical protein